MNTICFRCSSNVTKNFHFVQRETPLLFCAKCVARLLYEGFGTSTSRYLVFQPQGSFYRVSFTTFEITKKHLFFDLFQTLQGACAYCTHEMAKALWFPHSQSLFSLDQAQRLGRRCIYANLYEISEQASLWIDPEIKSKTEKKRPKEEDLGGILEFFPLDSHDFEALKN